MNDETTKSIGAEGSQANEAEEMRAEYRFDYSQARPNRFAPLFEGGAVAVVLDPDVASVFGSSERVNALLRSVIAALPASEREVAKTTI